MYVSEVRMKELWHCLITADTARTALQSRVNRFAANTVKVDTIHLGESLTMHLDTRTPVHSWYDDAHQMSCMEQCPINFDS